MGEYARKLQARAAGKKQQAAAAPKQMSNADFLRKRRMFCVIKGKAHVAELGDSRYHRQWMDELVGGGLDDRTYNQSPRGFYLAPEMVWYRGAMQPVSTGTIRESLADLTADMALPSDTEVYTGARSGPDDVFTGAHLIGTIQDLLVD
jgi:hypothetical protein